MDWELGYTTTTCICGSGSRPLSLSRELVSRPGSGLARETTRELHTSVFGMSRRRVPVQLESVTLCSSSQEKTRNSPRNYIRGGVIEENGVLQKELRAACVEVRGRCTIYVAISTTLFGSPIPRPHLLKIVAWYPLFAHVCNFSTFREYREFWILCSFTFAV